MKSLLKQASLLMLCTAVSISPVWAGNSSGGNWDSVLSSISTDANVSGTFSNANSAVDATKFFKGRKKDKKFQLFSEWLGVDLVKDSDAFKDVHKEINKVMGRNYVNSFDGKNFTSGATGYIDKVKGEFTDGVRGNLSTITDLDTKQLGKDMAEDIQTKAKDIATGRELKRLINEEVIDAMSAQADRTSKVGEGIPTIDIANIATGMFSLDSVFGTFHADEGVRDEDTRSCSAMGISPVTGDGPYADLMKMAASALPGLDSESPGFICCLKWSAAQEAKMIQSAVSGMSGSFAGTGESLIQSMRKCCSLSPELCESVGAEKAECTKASLNEGASLSDSLKKCAVECGKTGYGDLKHGEDGKYNPDEIDKLVLQCEKDKKKWAPSPTVLSADELAPVVPSYVENKVSSK